MAAEAWNTSELLAACCGASVKVWAPAAAEPRREVKITEGADTRALDWSGNNKVLAVAGDRSQITMVGGGKVIGYVPESPEPALAGVTALKFSADSKRLAIGCANRGLHIRDLRSQGAGSKSITDHHGAIAALAISPDDALLASSSSAGQLLVHDFKSGARLGALPGGDGPLRHALAFCPAEPDLLAAAGDDGGVGVWSVRRRALRHDMRRLHRGGTTGVRFAPDSPSVLYTCGGDMRLLVLDTRQPAGSQEALVMHAPQPLTCLDARFDARSLAVGTAAGGVLVFDLRAPGQPANAYSFGEAGPVRCVRWQNAPSSSSKAKAAAAAAAASAATAPSLSFGGQLGRATPSAAGGLTPRENRGGAASGLIGAGRAGGAGGAGGARTPRSVTPEMGARGAVATPELSHASELSLEGMRAVSPVRMAGSNADGTPSAATAAPGPLTPGDSFASGMAAFMVTPGVGLTRGLTHAGANGGGLADGATPVSRLAPFGSAAGNGGPGAAAAAGASASAATALPPAAAGGRGALANGTQRAEAGSAAAGKGAAAGRGTAGAAAASRPPTGSRPASSAGMAATGAKSSSGNGGSGAAGNASGGGAAGSAPSSRAGSIAASAAMDAAAAAAVESLPASGSTTPRLVRGDGAAAAAAAAAAGGAAAAGPGALREDVFKGYVDQQMAAVRQDVRNLHLEVLQQFHQAQMDLMSVAEGLAQRQEAILQRLDALGEQVQGLADARGVAPGISLAWL